MDALKANLKDALDTAVYKDLELDEAGKQAFLYKVKSSPEPARARKFFFKPAFAGIAALLVLVLLSVPFLNKLSGNSSSNDEIEQQAAEIFGHEVAIPELKGFSITFVAVYDPQKIGRKDLTVEYAGSRGKLDPRMDKEKWEKENESHLLYGPFERKLPVIRVRYQDIHPVMDGAKTKNVNGFNVQYEALIGRPAGDFYFAIIDTKNVSYSLEFMLDRNFTEKDVDQVLVEFTKQLEK